ncbi:hypothetical protein DL93DRAFT_782408 [Clavulina sp. PMI_390]|nr:hypothetical protein DL93DRAFT_782408 [Clavulina sp. PMI_390]
MVCWTVPILLVLASYIFPLCSCAILPASSLLRPYPLNFNPSQPTTAPLVPTDNANIIYSTNPHIYYLQGPLCAVSFSTECDQREYAWKHISFHSEALNKLESYAAVTTKHNDDDENTPRRVEIDFPPSINSIYIFAAPRSQVVGQPVAHQNICFSDSSQITCEDIDVSMAYTAALDDDSPVLLWAGKVPPRFPQGFRLTIRMNESAHTSGQQSGLMSFYAAVFTESDTESLSSCVHSSNRAEYNDLNLCSYIARLLPFAKKITHPTGLVGGEAFQRKVLQRPRQPSSFVLWKRTRFALTQMACA